MITYKRLFVLMAEKGLTTYKIRKNNIVSQASLSALLHDRGVSTTTIDKLCAALNCQPGDIMDYVPDSEQPNLHDIH